MTSNDSRDDLLGLIGIEDAAHASPIVLTRILRDHNKTLRDIYAFAPHFWVTEFTPIVSLGTATLPIAEQYREPLFLPVLRANFSTWKHVEADSRKALMDDREAAWKWLALQISKSSDVTLAANPYTTAGARDDLLGMAGIERPTAATGPMLRRIVADINGTLQEIHGLYPHYFGAAFSPVVTLGTASLPIADRFVAPVFLPLLRARFTAWPGFPSESVDKSAIKDSRESALETLRQLVEGDETGATVSAAFTAQRAALDLCSLVGVTTLAAAPIALRNRILSDMNKTLQKLWTMVPQWWNEDTQAERLRAPVAVSGLGLTNGAKTISGLADAWMAGCTIAIEGQEFQNQLGAITELVNPYTGPTTANGSAIVYQDAINLGETIAGVLPPVILLGERELASLRGRRDVRTFSQHGGHRDEQLLIEPTSYWIGENRDVDVPIGYYVERAVVSNRVINRLRLSPLPDREYVVQFQVRLEAPRLTAIDSTVLRVPQQYVDSIFLPMLRLAFASWPEFKNQGNTSYIRDDSNEALQLIAKLKPQPVKVGRIRIPTNW